MFILRGKFSIFERTFCADVFTFVVESLLGQNYLKIAHKIMDI